MGIFFFRQWQLTLPLSPFSLSSLPLLSPPPLSLSFFSFSAQGENQMVIGRLRAQLDKAIKDEKQLLEQLLQKKRKHSVKESTLDSSYPSSGGEG